MSTEAPPPFSATGDSSPARSASRTIAILAKSACSSHRTAIQARITSDGFAILSERLEQWSRKDDADFVDDFLHDDTLSEQDAVRERSKWTDRLTEAPIFVMVLERHRAAEMWRQMCGPDQEEEEYGQGSNGETGLQKTKTGLRAEYGADALYASPPSAADRQIAICFPELATTQALSALQIEAQDTPKTVTAVDSNGAFLVREDDDIVYDDQGRAFDSHSGEPLELQQELVVAKDADTSKVIPADGQRVFKARPLPASHKQTATQPRLSRAAALRMGIALPEPPKRAASSISSDGNLGISGMPKADIVIPKSLAAPTIAPRMNRVAASRTNGSTAAASAPPVKERKPIDYSNTPGHKRASTGVKLASLATPSVAPRLNKVAAARVSAGMGSTAGASMAGRATPATGSTRTSPTSIRPARPSSVISGVSSHASSVSPNAIRKPVDFSNTPGHKRASMSSSSLKSLQAPTIAPRGNRTSLARGGVGQAEEQKGQALQSPVVQKVQRKVAVVPRPSGKESDTPGSSVRERKPVDYSNTPGHKRASQSVSSIASLGQPSIVPRSNAATQKRLSAGGADATVAPSGRMSFRGAAPPSSFRV